MEYEFTLPVCKKQLRWRSLRVQESIDERSSLKSMSEEAVSARMLIARVTWYDGNTGRPGQADWGAWDELDMEFFLQEVAEKEGARRAAFRKAKIEASDPQADLKRSLADLQVAAEHLGRTASLALEAAELAERAKDPTQSGRT